MVDVTHIAAADVLASKPPDERPLAGPNILLLGESGTGKTFSLGTLVDWAAAHGKEVFYLGIENSLETLLGYWRDRGAEVPKCLHWHQVLSQPLSITSLIQQADNIGKFSYESLTKMVDAGRAGLGNSTNSFWQILQACADFPDDRTGQKMGPVVGRSDESRIFIADSFTELSEAAVRMTVGNKPTMAPPDYGVAQKPLMAFLRLCTQGTPGTFVMTAHPAKDKDELSGAIKTTVKTVGTAIQPEIPPLFSDMIYTVREGDQFYWDTAAYGVVTKTRSLGYRSKIKPDFAQIMDLWVKRGGK